MKNTHHQSCTTVLVGKKATVDGSIMIARNEDFHEAVSVKLFTVMPPLYCYASGISAAEGR